MTFGCVVRCSRLEPRVCHEILRIGTNGTLETGWTSLVAVSGPSKDLTADIGDVDLRHHALGRQRMIWRNRAMAPDMFLYRNDGDRMRLLQSIRKFLFSDDGPTAVEYCVMLAFILLAVIVGVAAAGGGVSGWWSSVDSDLQTHGF